MNFRFQITNYPACLYQKLDKESKPVKDKDTGRILYHLDSFFVDGVFVKDINNRSSSMPDSRIAYIMLSTNQAKLMKSKGISLELMRDNLGQQEYMDALGDSTPTYNQEHGGLKFRVSRRFGPNSRQGSNREYKIKIEGVTDIFDFFPNRDAAIEFAKDQIDQPC